MSVAVANGQLLSKRKLSLACGNNKPDGFHGIDVSPDTQADTVLNLLPVPWQPWPIKSGSAREVDISHFVEHIPHWRPGWEKDGWFMFFEELWRVCADGAEVTVTYPYCQSGRAFWDPTHERYVHEATWMYFSPDWRQREGLAHYTHANFEEIVQEGSWMSDEWLAKNDQQQAFARNHYWNAIADIRVVLKAVK